MSSEAERQARIMLAVGALPGVRLFRNTVGVGFVGQQVNSPASDLVILRNAKRVTFGLHVGSHDLIGWKSVIISPDMVGHRLAIFLGGEIKAEAGKLSVEQSRFHHNLLEAGGLSGVWRTPGEALKTITKQLDGTPLNDVF